jgi:hypothetical protein
MEERWKPASERFENTFVNSPFSHECDVCVCVCVCVKTMVSARLETIEVRTYAAAP